MSHDSLGDRMKAYETVPRHNLVPRLPVLIRVDGKAFHTFTQGMHKPFDSRLTLCMWETAKAMCKAIEGAQVAYVQSDEISVLLIDYQTITTQGWFDYDQQKLVSVSAAIATAAFNREYTKLFDQEWHDRVALFDSRTWNLPKEEVTNYFIWRQKDAERNSINCLGQAHFSHKQLHGLSVSEVQEKLFQEKNIQWNTLPTPQKRGVCVVKERYQHGDVERTRWVVDDDIPVFTKDREYLDRYVFLPQVGWPMNGRG